MLGLGCCAGADRGDRCVKDKEPRAADRGEAVELAPHALGGHEVDGARVPATGGFEGVVGETNSEASFRLLAACGQAWNTALGGNVTDGKLP